MAEVEIKQENRVYGKSPLITDNVMLGLVSVDEAMGNGSSLTMVKVDNLELYPKKISG